MESIISVLGKAGLVEGLRGKGGGYRLSRELKDYSVGEILRLSEGSLAPVACLDGEVNRCPRAEKCQTLPVWEKLDELINGYLEMCIRDRLCSAPAASRPMRYRLEGLPKQPSRYGSMASMAAWLIFVVAALSA